jgi:sugar (pentulose or hexulose) kinase
MTGQRDGAAKRIASGAAVLGIELGSTRIKASLIAPDSSPLAAGSHTWENRLEDGVWTYSIDDVESGLAGAYAALAADVRARYAVDLRAVAAMGVSAMMHGYLALDDRGELLVPFRTWRNNFTETASGMLTQALDFPVPQRWSVAHLYQSVLEDQPHLPRLAHLTTLAGYVHWRLTGERVLGVGDASGMFPVDAAGADWDMARLAAFDALVRPRGFPWTLRGVLPAVLGAGRPAGWLTPDGARLLDPTGALQAGVPFCPPEGDAGTGMVATNAVRPRSGNVSAGTSVFAMIVLEHGLGRLHPELDIVTTPDGSPVAMAHSNNGSSDLDAWMGIFGQVAGALGHPAGLDDLYGRLVPLALAGDADAGGLLSVNYVSGEHQTGFAEGRPLFARKPDSAFTLPNFIRAMLFASLCAMRSGLDILTQEEGVAIDEIRGHGGFFRGGDTGQRIMAAALGIPVSTPAAAGEGGAWGMALLAAYMLRADAGQALSDYLDERIAGSIGAPVAPDPRDVEGFNQFYARHRDGLAIEREAVSSLR